MSKGFLFTESFIAVRIRAELTNKSPLSIGAGRGEVFGGIDNPIVRMGGSPYIPGSSLKGVLRVEAERYARANNLPVCDVFSFEELEWRKREGYEPCIVCRVFGGPTIASHLIIGNAMPISYRVETRTMVSINRITGAQHAGRLYDIEYITPGSRFEWELAVIGYDIVDGEGSEVALINHLVRKITTTGIWVGGRRSIGNGLIVAEIRKVVKEDLRKPGEVEDVTDRYLKRLAGR